MEGSFGNEGLGAPEADITFLSAVYVSLFGLSLFCEFSDASSEISLFSLIEGFLPLLTIAILTTCLLFGVVNTPPELFNVLLGFLIGYSNRNFFFVLCQGGI
jgi:hypothetical protein